MVKDPLHALSDLSLSMHVIWLSIVPFHFLQLMLYVLEILMDCQFLLQLISNTKNQNNVVQLNKR